jgi:hypothetical protein
MKKLLIALMTLGAFSIATVAITPAAYAKAKKHKKKSKKKGKHARKNSRRKHHTAEVEEPRVNLPVNAESAAPVAPRVDKSSTAESIGADPIAAPANATPAHPVHRL